MKLTTEMKMESLMIARRMAELKEKYYRDPQLDNTFGNRWDKLKLLHLDEIMSYKVKLENFYSDTDSKEKVTIISIIRLMYGN